MINKGSVFSKREMGLQESLEYSYLKGSVQNNVPGPVSPRKLSRLGRV